MRGKSESEAQDMTASLSDADCLPGEVDVRFELAKSILSSITSPDLFEDESTPQGKAIRWIVCDDSISVQLLENQDTVSGNLPKQKHGFRLGGDAGAAQVTRRYILAAFFHSTSQVSPWIDSLNFLSPDLHECNWHKNYTRSNFPFGDFDPVGVFCEDKVDGNILLDDYQYPVEFMQVNIRIVNDMNGPLPPEIGYLMDCRSLMLENHLRLTGPLPQTMGNMAGLFSVALLLNGPNFGGALPSSLFQLNYLNTIHIQDNLGKNWSLPANVQVGDDTQLERLLLVRNSFAGIIPPWISKLKQLQTLDLSKNNFQGAIPETIGDLSSVKYLNLLGNNLTESIPSSVGKLSEIDALILGENALQGELPASIGTLRTLQLLDVGSNELTSTIPSSFANLESLKYLVLESNSLNGTVDVLESMKNLTVLLTRSNSFSGALPDGLFSGTSDNVVVDIGDNKFTGELPISFANMSNLVSLFGPKNSFADNATQSSVCDNSTLLVMDCDACECCKVCCDGENDGVCDFKLDVRIVLGYDCGAWYEYCVRGADYFAGVLY
ncbi:leucine-rich repeat domain-containing protein [Skeletonema marinoi]|uniref:Leucine-rich repeat domain-containing protein n=1 Tax=Skeletonema marinoi TaxID=267567 RepID=A0AAD8Y7X8_9STRA|nr:leucine-rich repeat domain-containing protein [Skeletonema marinoi]